jgi:hypothetical protein
VASSTAPGRLKRQELDVDALDEEGDDLDRQIPSSSSRALLEMEDPLHGVRVNLARRPSGELVFRSSVKGYGLQNSRVKFLS